MNKLDKIPTLRKLARNKGITLVSVDFCDPHNTGGVTFTYRDDKVEYTRQYGDPDWGIEEEMLRLRKP